MPHVLAGRVGELGLLQVKSRFRKPVEIADVVVVKMGENDVVDFFGGDAEQSESLDGIAEIGPLSPRRDLGGEAAVDDEPALRADDEPTEIVHRHRTVVRVAANEMILSAPLARRIAQRKTSYRGGDPCSVNRRLRAPAPAASSSA